MISSIPTLSYKTKLSAALAQEVEAFLATGGTVVEIPFGVGQAGDAETYRGMQSKIAVMNREAK